MTTSAAPQRIWLTGATSGIGEALAMRFLREGHRVALTARRRDALEALAAPFENALVVPADLTDRTSVTAAGEYIEAVFGGLELALLNAGTCEYVDARNFDVDLIERVLATNLHGTLYAIDAALPLLRRARHGTQRPQLAAVSSASAYFPLPRAEAYGASKAAISYFLASLRLDLAAEGIDVSVIHPGFVRTPLTERNDFPMPMRVEVDTAVEAILRGLEKRALDIHFPRRFTLLVKLAGILPPTLRHRLGRRLTRNAAEEDRS
ncbi:SDR family NAD(P)-dependent oxidoreductase [Chromohalobacter sp. HP20-39]|uniref:SDR family NAD(P)-dependent oxidoreductase n=1 Tax=Chromohalobacter sp. HP20-39 TaxID=3079306 RepID=UPI00294B658C|nr:SDR family NAD(P)-dependent oxidoreductase [Chromohalobacter sp. HP20-39]MDV6320474.1 SDR family NAD(P)-dependent oxidoreductase [Chromohalobacter sp. HP20-39]